MSKAIYDFGGGHYHVQVSSREEAEDVIEFLLAQGGVFNNGYATQTLAKACVSNYPFIGTNDKNWITGWVFRPDTPYFTYAEFRDQCLQTPSIETIDDLL
mgnify:CR=1 FL=1